MSKLVELHDEEVLDVYNKDCWILLSATEKSKKISKGTGIAYKGREALVNSTFPTDRENRIAIEVTYLSEHQ